MKAIFFIILLSFFLFASEYQKGKIDMHGGKYHSITGYQTGGFKNSNIGTFLMQDHNTTKREKGEKNKKPHY